MPCLTAASTGAGVRLWAEVVAPGQVVVVQLHGGPSDAYDVEADAGARVLTVLPYRSALPDDPAPAPARELVQRLAAGQIDLLVFASPGAWSATRAPDRDRA